MQSKYSRKLNNWKEDSTKKDSLKKEGVKMEVYKETIMLKSHGKTPTYVNITPCVVPNATARQSTFVISTNFFATSGSV